MFDTEELLHLAIKEMQDGSSEKALTHLKNCLEQDPENANAQYLLGALHAELGMYERAAAEMEKSLALNPKLWTARFQLGLLYITSGNAEKASGTWEDLSQLGEDHSLFLFKEGLLNLASNEFALCIEKLEKGIENNTENLPLNNDMLNMIAKAKEALTGKPLPAEPEKVITDNQTANTAVSLSAYETQNDDTH